MGSKEGGAFVFEVVRDGLACLCSNGDEAGFVTLSGDAEKAVIEVEELEAGIAKFGKAQPGRVEEFEEGQVPATEGQGGIDRGEEGGDILRVEGFGKVGGGFGRKEWFGGVGGGNIFA